MIKKITDSAQAQDLNLGTMPSAKAAASLVAERYQNTRPSLYLLRSELALEQLTSLRFPDNQRQSKVPFFRARQATLRTAPKGLFYLRLLSGCRKRFSKLCFA